MTVQAIERAPLAILGAHLSSIPVDVEAIATDFGIPVSYETLPDNISGHITRDEGTRAGYRIGINSKDHERRQRFTLAHEIAHYILHRDLLDAGLVDSALYRSKLSDDLERQANRFAAEILLPPHAVRSEFKAAGGSMAALAAKFNVSIDAIRIRAKELRLAP
jgi:hypothetical protein